MASYCYELCLLISGIIGPILGLRKINEKYC